MFVWKSDYDALIGERDILRMELDRLDHKTQRLLAELERTDKAAAVRLEVVEKHRDRNKRLYEAEKKSRQRIMHFTEVLGLDIAEMLRQERDDAHKREGELKASSDATGSTQCEATGVPSAPQGK